ncbi:MAG TPA: alkaline phosphatase family protein [Terriglobales bacterium]|nr:alkaline phosphatase family protein [Terriglobales bacterium]
MSDLKEFAGPVSSQNAKSKPDSPIKHLVVLMLENRSFDHMLGYLDIKGLENVLQKNCTNKDKHGKDCPTKPVAEPSGLTDPGHDFEDVCMQLYGGYGQDVDCEAESTMAADPQMQGFIRSYAEYGDDEGREIMQCFDPNHIPVITTLAKEYAVCDHWFSSIPGPTLPNRLFAHAGTASGRLDISAEEFGTPLTIYEVLNESNVGSTIYAGGWTAASTFWNLMKEQDQYFGTLDDFFQDCYDYNLPGYSFLEPRYSPGVIDGTFRPQNDQHPDSDVAQGELLIYSVYQAIRSNPAVWNSTMLVIVYDEHGGIYDHVPPPKATPPDDKPSLDPKFNFDRYGVRVPAVIVSAYTSHVVCKDVFDHTSLIATARKVLTTNGPDDRLGKRAKCANTFDTDTILNHRDGPRKDHVSINAPMCKPNLQKSYCLNHLQISHLKQALCLNQKLPKSLQVAPHPTLVGLKNDGPDSDFCKIDPKDADHFTQSVSTTVRHLGPKFREMLEKPCTESSSNS